MDSILIIDDEPQIRKLLSRMMELEGYESFKQLIANRLKTIETAHSSSGIV